MWLWCGKTTTSLVAIEVQVYNKLQEIAAYFTPVTNMGNVLSLFLPIIKICTP